jgi:hypothetical protein
MKEASHVLILPAIGAIVLLVTVATISAQSPDPSLSLEVPVVASQSAADTPDPDATASSLLESTPGATTSATPSATVTPVASASASVSPSPSPSVPENPLTILWNFLTGGGEPLPDAPPEADRVFSSDEQDGYRVVAGRNEEKDHRIWVRPAGSDVWDEIPVPDGIRTDIPVVISENGVFWLNEKRTALYRFDLTTRGTDSSSYSPSNGEDSLEFRNAAGEDRSVTFDLDGKSFMFSKQ